MFILTISLFSTWGYQWVQYILSMMFNVVTESNMFDLFIGLIAMIASVFIFIGAIGAWRLDKNCLSNINKGVSGFFFKNVLDI